MDKLVAIRIKHNDGTYSNEIPLSVLAINIDWDGTHSLVDVLGNVDLNKGSIQEQINALITTITPDNVQWDLTHTLSDVLGDVDLDKGDLQTQIDNISDGEIQVDSTLTAAGKAADAKAVGDNLKNVVRVGNSNVTNFTSIILGDTAEQVNLLDQSDLIDINARLSALENGDIQVDQTLSVQGMAADAKATGDAIHNLQGLVGTPLVAATAASMTNTNKIYVYTGSETGYTNGNWYYYDGTAWVSGGVYNSVALSTDKTLSVENSAADAKKTGDRLINLDDGVNNLINGYFIPAIEQTGNVSREDGSIVANSSYSHSDYIDISGYNRLTTRATQGSAFNAFYTSDKTFISAFNVAVGVDQTIVIPDNAVYMRVSNSNTKYADTFIFKYLSRDNIDKINNLSNSIDTLADQSIFIPIIEGLGYISNDGTVAESTTYSYSDYIDISDYDKLYINAAYGSSFNAFYASDKTFINVFSVAEGNNIITIPNNAKYIRVSNTNAKFNDTFVFQSVSHSNAVRIKNIENAIDILSDQTVFIPLIAGTGYVAVNDANVASGDIASNASYSYSDYIDISDYDKLYVSGVIYNSAFNAFYDVNKTYISNFTVPVGNNTITIPENAVYMRVSASTARFNDTFIFKTVGHSNAVRIGAVEEAISDISNNSTDYFIPAVQGTGNISTDDGTIVSSNYLHSDYIDISQYSKLLTCGSYDSSFNAFYDSNKTFIEYFTIRAGNNKSITIPDNAVYMRVSASSSRYEDTMKFRPLEYVTAVKVGELDEAIENLADTLAHSGDTFSPPSVGNGNISRDDGSIVSGSYLHSDYIDISQFPKLLTVAQYDSAFNAFYDADKNFISSFDIRAGTDQIIIPPFGTMYMRLSASSSKYADTMHFRTLEYVTSDALPDYWFGHITEKCNMIRDHMNTIGKNGETFIFATDIHWYRNQQKSPILMKYLLNNLNINMVFLGGDLITQGAKDDEVIELLRCVKAFKYPDIFVPTAFGNHDNNSNQDNASYRFDANTVYSLIFKGFEDKVHFLTDTEMSFYFDKEINKTRYIFLDMGDDGVSKAFTAFTEFRDTLLSTPTGYKIIIIAHIIDYGTFTTSLTQMIDAYNNRESITVNNVVCNFANASGNVFICLGGHRHFDSETTTSDGTLITVTDCDAMLSTQNTQTAGTISEQAFDVISLDYTNSIAYYERIGRGKSRIFHLIPISASTVLTTALSGTITWSSSDDNIATVNNGTITRVTTGTVIIKADNEIISENWICK